MNCPKCKSEDYVASPCFDNASGYGTSRPSGDKIEPNQIIIMKSGCESVHICTKCNVWFKVKQDFENEILVREKIDWEVRKDPVIPVTGSVEFWRRWKNAEKIKARKQILKNIKEKYE